MQINNNEVSVCKDKITAHFYQKKKNITKSRAIVRNKTVLVLELS